MQRVFIIGWDGATFDLIKPWVAEGKLPTIARLMQEGVHGLLRSTVPPWTFPAWSSFMTGKNPGKHGIFDFTRPKPHSYDLEFVNGGKRRGDTFWKILSQAGRAVISISLPCTFPPENVNGVMISGFDAPGGGPGSYVDEKGMKPEGIYQELCKNVGPHPIGASVVKGINQGRPDLVMEEVARNIQKKAATAKYLMKNKPWDCFMILFGESDMLGHQLWKYSDPRSPLFVDKPAGMRDSLLHVYEELDRQAGELLKLVPAETTVMMMSDHGFGGVSNWMLYPNCWLHEQGFLRFRGQLTHARSRTLDAMKLWAVSHMPAWLRKAIYKIGGERLARYESQVRFGMIDWSGTRVYCEENPYYPAFWVNLKGRQPQGTVEPGLDYERVRDELIAALRAWRHPRTNAPIVDEAYRREDVYSGPCLEQAPDVVAKWGLCEGYSYAFKLSSKSRYLAWLEQVDPNHPENLQYYTSKSGSHRDDGIFVAQGPVVERGRTVQGSRIIDLAPTILHLLGVPASADMDGRVLEEIFTDRYHSENPVAASAGPASVRSDSDGVDGYSSEDEEKISERLKALGYVD
jgi:predicted AlkP superfamily phosphohydrolase/phosphomutase